jgi:hypothetical protein
MRIHLKCFSTKLDAVILNFMDGSFNEGSQFVQVDTEANSVQFSKKSSKQNVDIMSK